MNKRFFYIIEQLLKNNGSDNLKNIANVLDVNERTIRNDLEKLNECFKEKNMDLIEKRGKGNYRANVESLELFIKEYFQDRNAISPEYKDILILIKIAFTGEININYLCEEYDLGRTTIKIALKEIKKMLELYNLELIHNSTKGLKLQGLEENIRRLQLKLLNQYCTTFTEDNFERKYLRQNILEYFYEEENLEIGLKKLQENKKYIMDFINRVINNLERVISDEAYETLINYILIMILRLKKEKKILKINNENFFMLTSEYKIISKCICELEEKIAIKIEKNEVLKLTDYFLGSHTYSLETSFYNNWIEIEILVKEIINNFSDLSSYNLKSDIILFDGIINHIKPTIYRIKNRIDLENSIKDEFKEYYPEIFFYTKKSMEILEKFVGETMSEDEISYIGMHFKGAMDRNIIDKKEIKNILLVCGLGYGTSKLLAQQIKERYDVNIVDTIPLNQIDKYRGNPKIDLVITTLTKVEFNDGIPVITIKSVLKDEDIVVLEKLNLPKYNRKISLKSLIELIGEETIIRDKSKLTIKIKELMGSVLVEDFKSKELSLTELLKEENIMYLKSVSDWRESIKIAGQILIDNGYSNENYSKKMIESIEENGDYIIVSDFIALPHGKNEGDVYRTGASLLILEEPIKFSSGSEVNIILAFCSEDGKEHLKGLAQFIDMIKKFDFYKIICEEKSAKKIIDNIKKYEFLKNLGNK